MKEWWFSSCFPPCPSFPLYFPSLFFIYPSFFFFFKNWQTRRENDTNKMMAFSLRSVFTLFIATKVDKTSRARKLIPAEARTTDRVILNHSSWWYLMRGEFQEGITTSTANLIVAMRQRTSLDRSCCTTSWRGFRHESTTIDTSLALPVSSHLWRCRTQPGCKQEPHWWLNLEAKHVLFHLFLCWCSQRFASGLGDAAEILLHCSG